MLLSENLLSFRNVSKSYYGNTVLSNINIEVKKGEIHALIGENGAGKSTLMNILFGMPVITLQGDTRARSSSTGKRPTSARPMRRCRLVSAWCIRNLCLSPSIR